MTDTKTLVDIRAELAALSTVTEDQYEAALSATLADLDAIIAAQATPETPVAPTAVSVVIKFSDGSEQDLPAAASAV